MLVKQAANVLELLEYFARRRRPATLAEISDDLAWPRSSTFNLVGTLAERGYLYEPRLRAGYYPTQRWHSVLHDIGGADPLPDEVVDLANAVAAETRETTAIATPNGLHAMFVHVVESDQPIRYSVQVGGRVPIHASSAGRALLAQMTADERQAIYRRIKWMRFSDTTPLSGEVIEAELTAADRRGYHQSNAEYIADLAGLAFALPVPHRRLSLVVAGPVSRCLSRRVEIAGAIRRGLVRHGLSIAG
ncbi:IclR family transcriptional regulator [Gemmobacter sp.]|uniref:IclR family transcriptional regulator n=1 Tax=Gemmobacter sp. TaxID=1898957 RepID=UPI002AFE6E4B|nr:IclR family transcriptional regulator [Gemmobacter sp.]